MENKENHFMNYFLANIIPLAIGLLSSLVYTYYLDKNEYGEYGVINTTVIILTLLFADWIAQGIMRFYTYYCERQKLDLLKTFINSILIMLFVGLLLVIIVNSVFKIFDNLMLSIVCFYFLANVINSFMLSFLRSSLMSSYYKKILFVQSVFTFIGTIILLAKYKNYLAIYLVKSIILIITNIFIFIKCGFIYAIKVKLSKEDLINILVKIFTYGFPIILTSICSNALQLSDRYFLSYFWGSSEVGAYIANYSVTDNINILIFSPIVLATHNVLINLYEIGKLNKLQKALGTIKELLVILLAPILIYVTIFSENVASIFINYSYTDKSNIIPYAMLGFMLFNYAMYNVKIYEFKNMTIKITKIILISFILNFIMNFMLIPRYASMGAAISTCFSYLFFYFISIFVNRKSILPAKIEKSKLVYIVTGSCVCLIGWLIINHFVNSNYLINNYIKNITFVFLTAVPFYCAHLFINYKNIVEIIKFFTGEFYEKY